jgi:hypothetical protein
MIRAKNLKAEEEHRENVQVTIEINECSCVQLYIHNQVWEE